MPTQGEVFPSTRIRFLSTIRRNSSIEACFRVVLTGADELCAWFGPQLQLFWEILLVGLSLTGLGLAAVVRWSGGGLWRGMIRTIPNASIHWVIRPPGWRSS